MSNDESDKTKGRYLKSSPKVATLGKVAWKMTENGQLWPPISREPLNRLRWFKWLTSGFFKGFPTRAWREWSDEGNLPQSLAKSCCFSGDSMMIGQLQQSKNVAMLGSPTRRRDVDSWTRWGMQGMGLYPTSKLALVDEILGIKFGALYSYGGHDGHGGHDTWCQKRDLPDVNLVRFGRNEITFPPDGVFWICKEPWHPG